MNVYPIPPLPGILSSFYFQEIKFKFHQALQDLPCPLSFSLSELPSHQPAAYFSSQVPQGLCTSYFCVARPSL